MRATVVSISGFSSNIGKTTLVCDLLRRYSGWEAIKVSRGHYRSCGKNPQACCISPMLGDVPLVLSGRAETFAPGKDTGRYWESGASNVHWVVCTDEQVGEGVKRALDRVEREGVFIEGTSLLKHIGVDYAIMVANAKARDIKSSAVGVMAKTDAIYIQAPGQQLDTLSELRARLKGRGIELKDVPVYFQSDIERLAGEIGWIHNTRLASV